MLTQAEIDAFHAQHGDRSGRTPPGAGGARLPDLQSSPRDSAGLTDDEDEESDDDSDSADDDETTTATALALGAALHL